MTRDALIADDMAKAGSAILTAMAEFIRTEIRNTGTCSDDLLRRQGFSARMIGEYGADARRLAAAATIRHGVG